MHGHHAGHVEDVDWAGMLEALRRADEVEVEVNAQIAGWLVRGHERVIVDLGCGAGGMTVALAAAAGPQPKLIAVDGQPALLEETRRRVGEAAVETRVADLSAEIPVEAGSADLIWAGSVVHHLPDQLAALRELAARLAPGGLLARGEGGLRPRSLPWDLGVGEPGLEVRLDLAQERWFAAMRRDIPGSVPMPAAAVDLVVERLRGFLDRDELGEALVAEDQDTLRRLTDLDDELLARIRDELFLLSVRTVCVGRVR